MKTHLYYSIITFLLATFNAAAFGQVSNLDEVTNHVEVSISLNSKGTNAPLNQPVVLRVVWKNLSTNQTVSLFDSFREESDQSFSFVITAPSGSNKAISMGPFRDGATVTIAPGEAREREFNLSRIYDFREIGVYKVVATYKNLSGSPYFEVKSNPLDVNVVKAAETSEPKTNNPITKWVP